MKHFIADIPTENNLYLANICNYTLNSVGQAPKVQEKVGSRYHVFNIVASDRVDVGIYSQNNSGNYYLFKTYQYRFNMDSNSKFYGMVTEQSEIRIKDNQGTDYSLTFQSLSGIR